MVKPTDEEFEVMQKSLVKCLQAFLGSAPGPWKLEPDRIYRNSDNKNKRFNVLDRDGKEILRISGEQKNIDLVMVATTTFPDFIRTLGSIVETMKMAREENNEENSSNIE